MTDQDLATRLSALRDALDAYGRLDPAVEAWPRLALVAVTYESARVTPDEAWRRANTRAGTAEGWVRHRSLAYRVGDGSACERQARAADPAAGPPVAGEWALDASASLHLRPDADAPGLLAEWSYRERPLAAADRLDAGEWPALRQVTTVLAHPAPTLAAEAGDRQAVLLYHTFWGTAAGEPPHALRRLFARFVRFDHDQRIVQPAAATARAREDRR